MADALLHNAYYHFLPSSSKLATQQQAVEAIRSAITIDPNSARAHRLAAAIERDFNWNWAAAMTELERSLAVSTDIGERRIAEERIEYLKALKSGTYSKEYEELSRVDLAVDPLDAGTMNDLAEVLGLSGRYEEAVALSTKALQLHPGAIGASAQLALELMYLHRYDEAISAAKKEGSDFWRLKALTCIHWAMGQRVESDRDFDRFKNLRSDSYHTYTVAAVYGFRGEKDEALKWLARAYQEHSLALRELNIDPMLRNLYGDQRFHDLQVRIDLAV